MPIGALGPAVSLAVAPERARPLSPPDGAVSGPRPIFEIAYEGAADDLRRVAFRITLSAIDEGGRDEVVDQRRRKSGWMLGKSGRVLYRPRRPLADGRYRWQAWIWDGLDWVASRETLSIRIDSVPPAAVADLRMTVDRDRGAVLLDWDPVSIDREGRPEYVARYHVYRFHRGVRFRSAPPLEIGVTELPRFVDADAPIADAELLFYRVVAEDEAGNRPAAPDGAGPWSAESEGR